MKASPCFAVYLASLTIVVIALDRYRCIVHSTKKQLSNKQVWLDKDLLRTGQPCYISNAIDSSSTQAIAMWLESQVSGF